MSMGEKITGKQAMAYTSSERLNTADGKKIYVRLTYSSYSDLPDVIALDDDVFVLDRSEGEYWQVTTHLLTLSSDDKRVTRG